MELDEIRLGVNIDHVATIRNARGTKYPDPLRAAQIVKEAGGDGITAHWGKIGGILLIKIS